MRYHILYIYGSLVGSSTSWGSLACQSSWNSEGETLFQITKWGTTEEDIQNQPLDTTSTHVECVYLHTCVGIHKCNIIMEEKMENSGRWTSVSTRALWKFHTLVDIGQFSKTENHILYWLCTLWWCWYINANKKFTYFHQIISSYSFFSCFVCFVFQIVSYVAQPSTHFIINAGLEILIFLPLPHILWNYRCVSWCPYFHFIFYKIP